MSFGTGGGTRIFHVNCTPHLLQVSRKKREASMRTASRFFLALCSITSADTACDAVQPEDTMFVVPTGLSAGIAAAPFSLSLLCSLSVLRCSMSLNITAGAPFSCSVRTPPFSSGRSRRRSRPWHRRCFGRSMLFRTGRDCAPRLPVSSRAVPRHRRS